MTNVLHQTRSGSTLPNQPPGGGSLQSVGESLGAPPPTENDSRRTKRLVEVVVGCRVELGLERAAPAMGDHGPVAGGAKRSQELDGDPWRTGARRLVGDDEHRRSLWVRPARRFGVADLPYPSRSDGPIASREKRYRPIDLGSEVARIRGSRATRVRCRIASTLLADHGFDLAWTDRHLDRPWSSDWPDWTERWSVPWVQAWLDAWRPQACRGDLGDVRERGPRFGVLAKNQRPAAPPLVVVSCWLADLSVAGGLRRSVYRWLYRAVDIVVVFSANQRETLVAELDIPRERICVVRLGVDLDELSAVDTTDTGTVVAAGRDLGRDWATLIDAAQGTGWDVRLITRAASDRGPRASRRGDLRGNAGAQ